MSKEKTNTGQDNSGDRNPGDRNSGNRNSGNRNSGDFNSGYFNSGDRNSGNRNSGYFNSGDRNSGDFNSGDFNSGDRNSGDFNSGDFNSGYWNSGDWNSGNRNSGYFNTDESPVRMFNKECDKARDDIVFPDWFYFDLTLWVGESEMTDQEKKDHDQYKVTGGYLKTLSYKEAWRRAFDNASDEERREVYDLPNWDNEIFKEITGIDIDYELNCKEVDIIVVGGKKFSREAVESALKAYVA